MAEVFSDDLNLKIGDLLSRNLLLATRPPCARPLMLRRTTQANTACLRARQFTLARPLHARSRCCLHKIQFTLEPALRAHTLLLERHQRLNTNHSERTHTLLWLHANDYDYDYDYEKKKKLSNL